MKILLMLPLNKKNKRYVPDIGLGCLASILRNNGNFVNLLIKDLDISYDEFKNYLKGVDVVGIKVFSSSIQNTRNTIKLIRKFNPRIKIIVGGPHPSADPKNVLNIIDADYAFYSESELGFPMLIDYFVNKQIKLDSIFNLIWRDKNKIRVNKFKLIDDLDLIPFPAWDLMPPKNFPLAPLNTFYKKYPIAPMETTRGCAFQCTYCNAKHINGLKVRKRSVKNIIDEIKFLYYEYGVREIQFIDSNCIFHKELMINLCKEIIKNKLDLVWSAPNGIRLDFIDEELLYWMKKAGCYLTSVGIESGSDRILKSVKKRLTVKQMKQKISLINKSGIKMFGYFMYGFPGETKEEIYKTFRLSLDLNIHGAAFSIVSPLPGTELYKSLEEKGEIKNLDFNSLDFRTVKNNFSELSSDELVKLQRKSYLGFYLRPRIMFDMFIRMRSLSYIRFFLGYALNLYVLHKKVY